MIHSCKVSAYTVDTPNLDRDWFGSTQLKLSYGNTKLGHDLHRSG